MGQADLRKVDASLYGSTDKRERLTDPYVTAGHRVYIIGAQDGDFPDSGGHIPGEMGGVWDHPVKLVDAFFVGVTTDGGTVWPQASVFRTFPFFTEHVSEQPEFHLLRRQFVPDEEEAAVIDITFMNVSDAEQRGTIVFAIKSDLRPGWLSEEEDGTDTADQRDGHLVFVDALGSWTAMVATSAAAYAIQLEADLPRQTKGKGAAASISIPFSCAPGANMSARFVIAGSLSGVGDCQQTLERVMEQADRLFADKATRYGEIDRFTALDIPDETIRRAVPWVKYNTDWLVRKTDMGTGLGAGLPEYPWWFGCDNGYALLGVLALGWFDLAKDTLRLLARVSEQCNGDGRIIHEVSTTGVVFNPGNAQETPQFCKLVWDVFTWTGDLEFLADMYPTVRRGIEWTLSQASGIEDFPSGYGIIEVQDLNDRMIDTAVYTYCALDAGAKMAEVLDDSLTAMLLRERADKLKRDILKHYWMEDEGLFADVISTPREMNRRLAAWAEAAQEQGLQEAALYYLSLVDEKGDPDGERPYLLRHWVINTPLEQGLAAPREADRALSRMRTSEFAGPHGLYLSGTERRAMMTISTAVQAMAEGAYGHAGEAVLWMRRIAATLDVRMPGAISEMSPDYGCFVQAWTVYGLLNPIVCHLFGVVPAAHERSCLLSPQMPPDWGRAALSQLRIGDNVLDFEYRRADGREYLTVASEREWTLRFACEAFLERGDAVARQPDGSFVLPQGGEAVFRF